MRFPIFLIAAATLLPAAVWAQAPATPVKPAAPAPVEKVLPAPGTAPSASAQSAYFARRTAPQPEPRVDLDLENATVREALKQIFAQAHQEYRVEENVPDEPRVTVHAKNVRLSTALELVLPEKVVGMTVLVKDGKGMRVFKVGTAITSQLSSALSALAGDLNLQLGPNGTVTLPGVMDKLRQIHPSLDLNTVVPYVLNLQEQRSTFRCPNCKGQSTVIRKADQPKCEKCSRVFLPDWQYCPADGTKRPAAAAEWRYCPFCGKRVEGDKQSGIPLLEDIPVLGRLFRNSTPAIPAPVVPPAPRLEAKPQLDAPQSAIPAPEKSRP